ncbi:hypothetical protein D5F01_LYC23950 [Larimichthys crocea]|uniref:Uncharacterized protein n=1 Tax=Larimichthys crocea TaxID=215358 RepID=A0A6G0HGA3_LARCR|nr:hypothetical protein D5F01_LYC23950 [Larimichthys crocea]
MAVAIKNSSGMSFLESPIVVGRCTGRHVDIVRYDIFLGYLTGELERATATEVRLSDEALIECLVKHLELISGPNVWSPAVRAYVHFDQRIHGEFAVLKTDGLTVVQFLGKLLPVYCRLCFLSECHDRAKTTAQALLARLTTGSYRAQRGQVADFEIRSLEYLIGNLSTTPPPEWQEVCQSSDVSVETKIAVELLWSHLVLVYAGNRRLLLCNVELFFLRRQDSLKVCPSELRAALFVHDPGESPPATDSTSLECPVFAGWQSCGPWTLSATGASFTGCTSPNRTEADHDAVCRTEPGPGGLVGSSADVAARSARGSNETLRAVGSCVVELDNNVFLHVLHVNTVGNQKFNATIFSKQLRRYGRVQSNTTKTKLPSRLRFVSDKKRLRSQHGYKNTRIEFSSNPNRSANYTSNAKYLLQPYFRGVFETVALSQGTCVVSTKPFMVSNENLTCYMYGVANPSTVVIHMKNAKRHFHTPFFFSSVNVAGEESRHQLFSSMSINSQKVRNVAEELPKALGKVARLTEIHVHLNRLCCELAQERRGTLTSQEKMCLVYLTEMYFIQVRDRDHPKHWPGYREAVRGAFVERYRSDLSSFQDKILANYHLKNPEFIHLVSWLLDNPSALHDKMIVAHEAYLREEGKVSARAELITAVSVHAERNPHRHPPRGFPGLDEVDFKDLGYSKQTLRLTLSRSRGLTIQRTYGPNGLKMRQMNTVSGEPRVRHT